MNEKREEIVSEVLKDWERLKKQENNVSAAMNGRDMLSEIDRLRRERDEWARVCIAEQMIVSKLEKELRTTRTDLDDAMARLQGMTGGL